MGGEKTQQRPSSQNTMTKTLKEEWAGRERDRERERERREGGIWSGRRETKVVCACVHVHLKSE